MKRVTYREWHVFGNSGVNFFAKADFFRCYNGISHTKFDTRKQKIIKEIEALHNILL